MTPTISMIVAVARDRAIGQGGGMPFHISADMRHFKALTMGKPIIMGTNTFKSLPKGALPGRRNIIVSGQGFKAPGAETVGSLDEALELTSDAEEVMIIGGGQIYEQMMPRAQRLYLTEVDAEYPAAEVRFPVIEPSQWQEVDSTEWESDPVSGLSYRYICLSRK